MRALRTAILTAGFALLSAAAAAEPEVGPGYKIETFTMPGVLFAGLSRDGDDLLITDLAAGRLYRRQSNGRLTTFGPIFPHGRDIIGDPTGPYRVDRVDGAYVVAQGWTPVDSKEGPYDHALIAVDDDEARVISNDFWNPFDFIASSNTYYVVDAARNSVERLKSDGTRKETFYSFSRIEWAGTALQPLSPTEFSSESTYEVDAVPTGIALHRGRLYVSLFSGFPFIAGAGKVMSLAEDGEAKVPHIEVEGLNAPVDVAVDASGDVLVLEHGVYEQAIGFEPGTGRLLSFDQDAGDRQVILSGLTRPISVLVWDERQLVVSELGGNLHFLTRETGSQR
jgi:hypothetical protein